MLISEYTGGGFGSKITGGVSMIIPALLAKKTNAPVMMRISREEETFIGRARPGFQGRMKVGFSKEGRITALDMFVICDNGPYDAAGRCSLIGPHRLAVVPAASHALARGDGADQYAAPQRAELAGRPAGNRHHRTDHRQSRAQARSSTRSPSAASTARRAKRSLGRRRTASVSTRRAPLSKKRSTAARSNSNGARG